MERIDLTRGFAQIGEDADLRAYLALIASLADAVPGAMEECAHREDLMPEESGELRALTWLWVNGLKAISLKYAMAARSGAEGACLTIDRTGSGLPIWQEVVTMAQEAEAAEASLAEMPSAGEIRAAMLRQILRDQVSPARLQHAMSQRLYREALAENPVLPPKTRLAIQPLGQVAARRERCLLSWAIVDVQSNLPVIYLMDLHHPAGRPLAQEDPRLLKIRALLFGMSDPDTDLALIAESLDEAYADLHPKQLRRFVLGPFHTPVFTASKSPILEVLHATGPSAAREWALGIRCETIRAARETVQAGVFSSTSRQVYAAPVSRQSYLMTPLPFQMICDSDGPDFTGIAKHVVGSDGRVTTRV
ncbi:hypothetical protein [Defluviimonas salinarum]|uniref:Uncharacterized protein n=1 Tax=Defluviimonas salinarum TaxID=2992147 RepID=A0ABT3J5K3_9RHOB|nr:hypothetical protein [Defluviimonas salinarum]MCW3782954.1 hypothetical protein [Defluviimonas salinarum]